MRRCLLPIIVLICCVFSAYGNETEQYVKTLYEWKEKHNAEGKRWGAEEQKNTVDACHVADSNTILALYSIEKEMQAAGTIPPKRPECFKNIHHPLGWKAVALMALAGGATAGIVAWLLGTDKQGEAPEEGLTNCVDS